MDASMQAYRTRELERNKQLQDLQAQMNVYYVDARAQDLFGESALLGERSA